MNAALYRANYGASPSDPGLKPVRVIRHQLNKQDYTANFTVVLANGHMINLPERELQATYPNVVYAYWNSYVGGRCSVTGYDMYHPFHILGHRKKHIAGELEYKIQWVGYPKKEATWETVEILAKSSEELKTEYDRTTWLQG